MTDKQAAALQKAREASARKRAEKSAPISAESAPEKSAPILSEDRTELISKLDKIIEINTAILEVLKKNSTSDKLDLSKIVK